MKRFRFLVEQATLLAIGSFLIICLLGGIGGVHGQVPPGVVSSSYGLTMERLDFIALDQQKQFNTQVTPRSNFVLVFRSGLLQTQSVDYTSAPVTGSVSVTFLTPLTAGERIVLLYWR